MRQSNSHKALVTISPVVVSAVVLLAAFTMPAPVVAQVHFEIPLTVSDGVDSTVLYFGFLSGANFCIVESDSFNGHAEVLLPPPPPGGIFDARFAWPRSGNSPCFDQGSPCDYRPFTSLTQRDTLRVKSQLGNGQVITVSWPAGLSSHFTALTLRYFDGSENVNVDMLANTSAQLDGAPDPEVINFYSGGLIIPVEPPPAPALLAPPNGATGQTVPVTLRWNVSSTAVTYHVQVSTDSNFVTTAVNDSTLTDTTRVATGLQFSTKYYWHVRGKNPGGWGPFSTRFAFTTQFQPPPAPTLVFPPNGQTGVPTTTPLQWNPAAGAVTYRLQVATTSGFTAGTIVWDDSTLTATADTVGPLQTSTQYFWRVNGTNPGGPGPYSTIRNFTTVLAPPPAPVLSLPPDGAVNVSLVPTLSWAAAPTASSYHLQVARDSLFGVLVVNDSTIPGTSRQIGQLQSNTRYFWQVSAKNAGGIGPWSSTFRFTTTLAPPAPSLVLPADSAAHLPATPTFVWTRVATATSYQLQIATDPAFSTLVLNDSTIADTTKTVSPLPYGARLLWRVKARNSSGSSDATPSRVFTIMLQPPGMPSQLSPANNLLDAPVTMTLRWTRVPLASGYEVPIAFDTLMTNVFSDTTVSDTFAVLNVLPSTANYWRVRAHNIEHSFGPWTPVRRFTSGNFPPAVPLLLYPAHGDTGITRNPTFRWTPTPGALTYRLQVANNIGFPSYAILFDDSTLTTPAANAGILPSRLSLFWRVRSKGTAGSSGYSLVFAFTTGSVTDAGEPVQEGIPTGFVLHQNYPNPFNPSTTIPFEIADPAFVTLRVYDLLGREVVTLVNEEVPAGRYAIPWNGQTGEGQPLTSGMYFVRMTAATHQPVALFVAVQKMLLLK